MAKSATSTHSQNYRPKFPEVVISAVFASYIASILKIVLHDTHLMIE